MIIDRAKLDTKLECSLSDINRWADFIELLCIKDGIVTPSDIIDLIGDGDFFNSLKKGSEDHLEKVTNFEMIVNDYFKTIHYRSRVCRDYYPFDISDDNELNMVVNWTEEQQIYIFLLLCSNISFMSKSMLQRYTSEFEKFCKLIMSQLTPDKSKVEIFGTAREGGPFHGNLKLRIQQLAKILNVYTTKIFDDDDRYDRVGGGDNGIDIFYYFPIDEAPVIPFGFAQCTCSYDKWKDKQASISLDRWRSFIEPLVPYPTYMFVPFSCHNPSGKFDNITNLKTILMDRVRIVKLMEMNEEEEFHKLLFGEYQTIDKASIYDS